MLVFNIVTFENDKKAETSLMNNTSMSTASTMTK